MKVIFKFIAENYELIILIVACLLDLVLFLFGFLKKKKLSPLGEVIKFLPVFISKAEEKFGKGNGSLKKQLVMHSALKLYEQLTGVVCTSDSYLALEISDLIEEILETPTKKGK